MEEEKEVTEPRKRGKEDKKKSKSKGKKKQPKKGIKRKKSKEDSDDTDLNRKKIRYKSASESENEEDKLMAERWNQEKAPKLELDEDVIGPVPLPDVQGPTNYGGQLLPGEGEAIASYVRDQKRIPRRGEVGLTSDDIEKFEKIGYVMSGSRHRRMNAVRIRKESQVYSAEEKRLLAQLNYEEKAKRENKILADFREMLQEKGLVQKPGIPIKQQENEAKVEM
eukprot:TRINITY_DN6124_c0_g2_i1.p1 TRINITY_DN6124_c0_g2~~TRINITY_DN6124_c0_g2_i1.p1  ORF type:complete len:223 (-),score=63.57 TRINITY_DN6124_c0_g2_i1:42-710(-)